MKRFKKITTLVFAILLSAGASFAQQSYSLSGPVEMKVSGTSTIHDWDMVAENGVSGQGQMTLENGKLSKINSLSITMNVESLKSGKSAMDKNAYAALNADKHPKITFQLTEVISISAAEVKAKGKMTIAGNSQTVTLTATYQISGNQIKFNGKHDITFSQFSLEAPTAVFGTIKTGDELTLSFQTTFSQKN
ncbi:YceI family protein [Algoriphagus hitonicola]|uniref:Polyisoprenoid-binding protein YceI n=1 Tax=Algoriphagus hitonicola TaxID=435880 RepID=A0A1I2QCF3_9BACT|nr:YceI family protein [Algoriphagus hitonicola]SFG26062.1 Polyisoprenoid-binding protein YceI [Algoriphagus hitonicola]